MAQLDDIVGAVMKKLKDEGLEEDTILAFTTDNGTENFTCPTAVKTPFAAGKGTVMEGGFRVPCIVRWTGKVPAGKVENGLISGLDWFPTLVAAAGDPDIVEGLKKGKTLGDQNFKVHLDGYNQLDLLTGKGPSKRNELFYFAEEHSGARADWRLQVPLHRSAERLARRYGQARHADPDEPPPGSVRAHGVSGIAHITTVGSSLNSGGSSRCNRRSRNSARPSSSSHRCKRGELQPGGRQATDPRCSEGPTQPVIASWAAAECSYSDWPVVSSAVAIDPYQFPSSPLVGDD